MSGTFAIPIGIDTYEFFDNLRSAGYTEEQASAQAKAICKLLIDFQPEHLANLATKENNYEWR